MRITRVSGFLKIKLLISYFNFRFIIYASFIPFIHYWIITRPFESSKQTTKMSLNLDNVKLLMVGAGGIGCELLKNLVLTGFTNIEVV